MKTDDFLIAKFHVYCRRRGKRKPYFRVLIFRNEIALRAYLVEQAKLIEWGPKYRTRPGQRYYARCLGCCTWWTPAKCKDPFIGTVCLALGYLSTEIVSHEMTHAAFSWVTNRQLRWKLDTDRVSEPLALLQGQLVRQFYRHFWRLKLHKRKRMP